MMARNLAARFAVAVMALAPAMALAQGHIAQHLPEGEQAPEGMPQLRFGDPLLLSKTVWLVIIFGIFFYICWRYLLPPVGEVLESRQARIEGDLDAARTAKAEADAAMQAHRSATAKARAEAQAAIAAAVASAQQEAAVKAEQLNAQLATQIATAEARIATARDAAMGALRQVSTETATALVSRLTGSADQAAIGAAVDRELAARGRA
jgi:F-type H+-transporting ATPase subunit b